MNIADINFGMASARAERQRAPHLLLEGYYDFGDHTEQLIENHKFLILGYKGSGKSAIGERLGLLQDRRRELYVKLLDLEEFPFRAFGRIVGGNVESEARYPAAWSWLLLVALLDSFSIDDHLISTDDQDLEPVLAILRQLGLLPALKIKELALVSSKRSIKAQIPKLVEGGLEQTGSSS